MLTVSVILAQQVFEESGCQAEAAILSVVLQFGIVWLDGSVEVSATGTPYRQC